MKKSKVLFTMFLLSVPVMMVSGQAFDPDQYLQVREQNRDLSVFQLENSYSRPSAYYLTNFGAKIDFRNVGYLDSVALKLKMTRDEESLLGKNLFFVTERLSYHNFGQAFHEIYNADLPVFVTTDAILHALHMSYDNILKTMEREIMAVNLEKYLKSLYDNFDRLVQKYGANTEMAPSLSDADLYITIAYSLILDKLQIAHTVSAESLRAVWEAIHSQKMTSMPLFTYPGRSRNLDFSQFTVRGHYVYTQQDQWMNLKSLEPYFRAMMWLGRTDFLLTPPPSNPWEVPWSTREIQRMQQGACLVNELALNSDSRELFEFNGMVISYLVGESDNITPEQYGDILLKLGISDASVLSDTNRVTGLLSALNSNPELGQKILSDFFLMDPGSDAPGVLPVSYRLSGQRFIIDSYVLGSVVFDKLVYKGSKIMRMMPMPLDVLFVLGNNDVVPLLKDEFLKYPYVGQLANMRYLVDSKPDAFWSGSLYNVWLNAIRELNPPAEAENQPLFMKSAGWHQEKMNTQLASWSHLRHDNLLYAKQSYTGGTGCSFPHSYIEPYPSFYGRLKQYASDAAVFFGKLSVSGNSMENVVNFFPRFAEVMGKLEILAKKQLEGVLFSDEENKWLQTMLFSKGGSGTPPYSGWYADLFFDPWDAAKGDFTVVDVHTQPTDESGNVVGKVLHTGVGRVNLGVFIAPAPSDKNRLMAFTGPVMSYYETITDQFKRMTDQEWEKLVWANTLPERPGWTNIYLAGAKGEARLKGAELPSQNFTGAILTDTEAFEFSVYPNPVYDRLNLAFSLERNSSGTISLFTSTGILVREIPGKQFISGRNHLQIPFTGLKEGVYLVRLALEDQKPVVKKIIFQ
jgi:hypothetical protein